MHDFGVSSFNSYHYHPFVGLKELVLSSNPGITAKGWATLGMAISAGCSLRSLYVDYNELGDSSASCILVAVAGTKSLETLDMECVGATETTGQVKLSKVNPLLTNGLSNPYHLDESNFIFWDIKTIFLIFISFCGVTSGAIRFAYVP